MQILRTFFYLLLAINIVLTLFSGLGLAGVQAPWQTGGEAERLKRQLSADKIILLNTGPVASLTSTSLQPAPASNSAPAAVTSNPDAAACVALKHLGADDVAQITTIASPLGEAVKLKASGVQPSSYWVNIPPGGGKDGAARRGEILAKAGITDYIIVRETGPNQFAISLGLFRSEEAAKRLIEQLQKKNVRTARITVRDNTNFAARVELRGSAGKVLPLVEDLMSRLKEAQREDCQPG